MEWIPGIIIAIVYFIYLFFKERNKKKKEYTKFQYLKMSIYTLFLGCFLGSMGAIKLIYFEETEYPVDIIYNTCSVLIVLFGDKVLKIFKINILG